VSGGNDFGSFCASQNVVIRENLAFKFSGGGGGAWASDPLLMSAGSYGLSQSLSR